MTVTQENRSDEAGDTDNMIVVDMIFMVLMVGWMTHIAVTTNRELTEFRKTLEADMEEMVTRAKKLNADLKEQMDRIRTNDGQPE